MEHLFKLKKDGKTVGYLELQGFQYPYPDHKPMFCGVRFQRVGEKNWGKTEMEWDSAHPFVTKDKNGKDVFDADEIKMFSRQYKVVWDKREFGWYLQDEYKAKFKLSYNNINHIELIEDKEDDR